MKFFLLVFVLSFKVHALDCVSQAANLSLGLKLQGAITYELFGDEGTKELSGDVCKTSKYKDEWADSKKYKLKMIKIIKNDFQTKGKTSAEFLSDLNEIPDKKEITDADICPLVEKQIQKDGGCAEARSLQKSMSNTNFLNMDFEQACRLMVPKFKESFKNRGSCSDEEPTKDSVVKRDPPGEEIAPADDGAPEVKTHVLKPKTREQVRDEQPARVRTNSGSAVSRQ